MKKKLNITVLCILLLSLHVTSSCSDFLDREYDSFNTKEMTFSSYDKTSRYLTNIYSLLPDGLNRFGSGAMFDAATDDGEHAVDDSNIQKFNTGAWNASDNPDDVWNRYWQGIRLSCEFIANADNVNMDKVKNDPASQTEYENRLKDIRIWKAEAMFLRAFFHFELLKRYGPIPYITSTLSIYEDYSHIARPSMDETVAAIVKDCDAAAEVLELTPWRNETALGHATKGAALALKSRLLLYAASPLYLDWRNTSEDYRPTDATKWEAAAKAAKAVIDLNCYTLHPTYGDLFANAFNSSEYILMRRFGTSSTFESYNFPVSYGGIGGMNPSQDLVDAYEMKDGSAFDWNDAEMAEHPFFNRDERLNSTIIVNGSTWQDTPVEAWTGGKDGPYNTNATKTGYYLKKYANETVNIMTGGGALGHTWPYFRLAEIYLNYAEALNEYDPGNSDILTYLNAVRQRAQQPDIPEGLSQERMREVIHNERRVELAFEEHRAWDVRRWKTASTSLGSDLRGVEITKKETVQTSRANTSQLPFPAEEVPEGWYYYDGDEFNGLQIDHRYWGIYGDEYTQNSKYGQPSGNAQTYRKEQVKLMNDGENTIVRLEATREDNPPQSSNAIAATHPGWWSGALSSRDAENYGNSPKYYPLFSRIEIRAKVPFKYGIWMGLWLRHYLGASIAELDIAEVFYKYYQTTPNKYQINQTIHIYNKEADKTDVNVNGSNRFVILDFNPEDDYHVYGVQVEPDPDYPDKHAIISMLLDGEVTNSWKTADYGDKYNTFVTRAIAEGHENTAWDIAITGQIGGPDENDMGYPDDADPTLMNVNMDVDWVRVFTRTDDPFNPGGDAKPDEEDCLYSPYSVEKRSFEPKMYWYPIPQVELLKTQWEQNPGW